MEISPALLAVFGLLLALWTAGAVWVMLRASTREQKSAAARKAAQRLSRLIEEGPAIPLLVRADGRIEAPERRRSLLRHRPRQQRVRDQH